MSEYLPAPWLDHGPVRETHRLYLAAEDKADLVEMADEILRDICEVQGLGALSDHWDGSILAEVIADQSYRVLVDISPELGWYVE
jgi:hypothetical protein